MSTSIKMLASEMSEAEAIEGAKRGDAECFEVLYSRHKRHVYSICLRMMGNVEAAEDLAQEAFLQLYRKVAMFRGDSVFSTWLHRVTVNIIFMRLRKKGLKEVSLEETMDPPMRVAPRGTSVARTGYLPVQSTVWFWNAHRKPSSRLSRRFRAARRGRIRAQRDCRDVGMRRWQQQIAASQGAYKIA